MKLAFAFSVLITQLFSPAMGMSMVQPAKKLSIRGKISTATITDQTGEREFYFGAPKVPMPSPELNPEPLPVEATEQPTPELSLMEESSNPIAETVAIAEASILPAEVETKLTNQKYVWSVPHPRKAAEGLYPKDVNPPLYHDVSKFQEFGS